MTDDVVDLIDKFRRLIQEKYPDRNETYSFNQNVTEKEPPGQQIGEGDVYFRYQSLRRGQRNPVESDILISDIQCFQQEIKDNDGVLLDMINSNAIYSCKKYEMNDKISQHMNRTGAYSLIQEFNETISNYIEQHLNNSVEKVTLLLNDLFERQCLTSIQVQQMDVQRSMVQMDYLYFLPDAHQSDIPFEPVMVCCLGPTIGISRYMSRLLQPIYDQVAYSTTFFKGSNVVHALENYAKEAHLQTNTLFASVHINDLCTIIPHEQLMETLQCFLYQYVSDGQVQGITIDTMIKLIQFVLQNQYFIFDKKIYRQIKGCGSNQPLNHLLANIYMFYWQADLVRMLVNQNEIYGRRLDEMFFTWNKSKQELKVLLKKMIREKNPRLSLTSPIGKKINYLDVKISHINDQLRTIINHDQDIEPRGLPFISDHPLLMYSTLIQACLIRAALVCSKVSDFENERRDIQIVFIMNGYTVDFIKEHVQQFFEDFHFSNWRSHLDQNTYDRMRREIIDYDRERHNVKIEQRKKQQNEQIYYIMSDLNGEELYDFQEEIKILWDEYLKNEVPFHNMNIEVIHRPKYPSYT
ncbi:unnamed protein product [Rotaria sordida]|uniref:Helix-turn-helix domain-containing protein n=2 Tax=Rotaria sordida TaxID=392033 RepID=A0A819RBH5_9BILA|nr:unnamed protein product [Rotaria sordida]CAF4044579.1 unnamed protein product [Rotaria sordida]